MKKKGLIIFLKLIIYSCEREIKFLTFFNYKNFITFSPLLFVLLLNPIVAEQLLTKSEILRKSNECFKDSQFKVCNHLFLEMERIQLVESEQNRYKCQASILGLQTELIEAYYFKELKKNKNGIMLPYVIKNC